MSDQNWLSKPILGALLDISGVLKDGHVPIPGSQEAFKKLKELIPIRLVTNETQLSRAAVQKHLHDIGYEIEMENIFSPSPAMALKLKKEGLRPYLFVHPEVIPDFDGLDQSNPNCLVMGDAPPLFNYQCLNNAFRFLLNPENKFFTLGKGKYYKENDELMLDVGPFSHALEFATGREAELVGKPSSSFFQAALDHMNLPPDQVIMIGDDIVGDVGGAQNAGMRGILVRTGKFRPRDENHPTVKPNGIVNDFAQAVDMILTKHRTGTQ